MKKLPRSFIKAVPTLFLTLSLVLTPLALVHAAGTASIVSLSPGATINVGKSVDFTVSVSGFTNPIFKASDAFPGTSISQYTINEYAGYFAWQPIATDVGVHNIVVSVTDSLGDSATVTQQITVNAAGSSSVSIEYLSPGTTVSPGQNVSFFILPVSFSSSEPTYAITDNFSGSSITSSDISSNGQFTWVPTANDAGTHTLTVTATDPLTGKSASTEEQITVVGAGSTTTSTSSTVTPTPTTPTTTTPITVSVGTLSLGSIATVGSPVNFTVSSPNLTSPTYTISDTFGGSTLSNADVINGNLMWTPTASDVGTHSITITGTDSGNHTASNTLSLLVVAAATTATPSVTTPDTTTATTASPSTPITFTTTITPGDQSTDVTNLQTLLTQKGLYSGPITGYFGSLTETAVESFQTSHSIDAIGTVGPLTIAALNQLAGSSSATTSSDATTTADTTTDASTSANSSTSDTTASSTTPYTFSTTLSLGSTGDDVTALQNKLTSLNMYTGPITGYFGSLTQTAVEQFQTANNISAIGTVGPATQAALNG